MTSEKEDMITIPKDIPKDYMSSGYWVYDVTGEHLPVWVRRPVYWDRNPVGATPLVGDIDKTPIFNSTSQYQSYSRGIRR